MDKTEPNQTDEELAVLSQGGDVKAFEAILYRYEPKMMRYANKFLAKYEDRQDAVQEVFLRAYRNINSFDTERKFSPWLYRVAHNTFINFIKKHGQEKVSFFEFDSFFAQNIKDENIDTDRSSKELREVLDQVLNDVPLKYREPLVLYYFEGSSYKEIGDILEIPESTVGVRLSRGKLQLRRAYNKNKHKYE